MAENGTDKKTDAPAETQAAPPVAAPKPKPEKIEPKKRSFHWWTPIAWAKDFVKGTVFGTGSGIGSGARWGLKIGFVVGALLFFAPVLPAVMGVATQMGLPLVGTGLEAIAGIFLYGLGGAAVGAAFGGAMGMATGGAFELKMRARREKYAEELAERVEMRTRSRAVGNGVHWRDYARAEKQYQRNYNENYFYFNAENESEAALNARQQESWVDRVGKSRAPAERSLW